MLGKRKRGAFYGHNTFRKLKAVEEITFDPSDRHNYLTGFHKRKQQRIKHAQEEVAKQQREEKIQHRKEVREERKREVEEHVKAVDQALRQTQTLLSSESEDEDDDSQSYEQSGIQDDIPEQTIDHKDQYADSEDEEEAIVTVEAVDITRDGLSKANDADVPTEKHNHAVAQDKSELGVTMNEKKRVWTREKPQVPKKKRKKFRYESVEERKQNRAQVRAVKAKKRAKRNEK